ncbi:MFS transporter [Cystobacter fuscus]|uniref:MFS transporter n=1 Tax=Cystobacter fuscus TaxID=43 RepID=UPI002B29FB0F|nr:MFS transporter [Cystobacter fuscus]
MSTLEDSSLRLKRQRTLRVLLTAEFMSMLGTQLSAVGMPWLVLQLTGSSRDMGLVMAAQLAAIAVFGVFGASLVGRMGPRRVMLVGDTVRGPLVALLPLLYYLGWLNIGVFIVVMFAVGAFYAPYLASQQSILPLVVGEDEALLSRATATLQTATRLSVLIGPLLSGVLITALGAPVVLMLDAASFVASAVLLRLYLPRTEPGTEPVKAGRRSVGAGARILLSDRLVGSWSLGLVIGEMVWQALFALLPVIALTQQHGSPMVAGVLLAMFGGGAVAGTLLVGLLLRRVPALTLAVAGRVALGLAFVMLLLPLSIEALAGCLLLAGFLNGVSSAPIAAVRALRIPPAKRTESLTVATALALAAGALGWALAGTAAQSAGLPTIFHALAVLQVMAAALFVFGARAPAQEPQKG